MIIKRMCKIIKELSELRGSNAKADYIRKVYQENDKEILNILTAILTINFDTRISTNLGSKSLNKKFNTIETVRGFNGLTDFLSFLMMSCSGSDNSIRAVQSYICEVKERIGEEESEFIKNLSIQNLKLGITGDGINKALGYKLIYNWEIQGGKPFDNLKLKPNETFALQQKLNGVRASYYNGNLVARSGMYHLGFNTIINEIHSVFGEKYFIDGELIRSNKENLPDNENFRKTLSIVNSETYIPEKEDILFMIYDIIPIEEFDNNKFTMKYISERIKFIHSFEDKLTPHLQILKVDYIGSDTAMIDKLLKQYDDSGLEGLMLYKDVVYKKSKHNGLIKVKSFKFSDLKIVGWFMGEETGKLKDNFGGFIVEYKGNTVRVGSGYTDEQRALFLQSADDYIGKIAEIKYKEESKDSKTRKYSLQFPVFQRIRDDKKDISYE